jgi:ATP-binding cassette subfamily B protein
MSQHAMWMSFRSLTQDQSVKDQKLKPGTVKRIARYALPYKQSLIFFLVTVVIDALLVVSTPIAFAEID